MNQDHELRDLVGRLLHRRAEGPYWDFKLKHHASKDELIHDVLCLANCDHPGPRFLIFGVHPENYCPHSIVESEGRRKQADLASLFRDNSVKFFQSRFPEFHLEEISVLGASLDVLVIEDKPHKPYFLVNRIGKVRAQHIYSRVCDTNTPVDQSAQAHDIERMWRERFGLNMEPLERMKLYLNDFPGWAAALETWGELNKHYKSHPEFTVNATDGEDYYARHEEWTRGEIGKTNSAGFLQVFYHQTCLARIRYVSFDNHKKMMVAPNWVPRGAGRFYFYERDSINYAAQRFLSQYRGEDHSTTLSVRGRSGSSVEARSRWGDHMRIPVLQSGELEEFIGFGDGCESLDPSKDDKEQYELFLRNQLEFDKWRVNGTGNIL